MPRVPLLLIKEQVLIAHEAHYAGGIHLFNCLALALSNGFDVHVITTATKSLVMHQALTHGLLGRLQTKHMPAEVISWTNDCGLHFHAVIVAESLRAVGASVDQPTDNGLQQGVGSRNSSSSCNHTAQSALIAAVADVSRQLGCQCKYLLDVDSLQHAELAAIISSNTSQCSSSTLERKGTDQQQQQPFMYALLQQLHQLPGNYPTLQQQQQQHNPGPDYQALSPSTTHTYRPDHKPGPEMLVLVQNIHHLPFGPCGTAPRNLHILQAWQQVSGIICVSGFVRDYIIQYVLPLTGLSSERVYVMHPAAVGAFGKGPWCDLGAEAADRLWGYDEQQQQQQQQRWQQRPVVGMLKCSREKGSDLFVGLAARLLEYDFLAVCADPNLQLEIHTAAAAAAEGQRLTNLRLVPPEADVSRVLQQMSVVLVPSVLHEAFGLVVIDAMLHGVPVIVADAGALGEAAAGAAAAVLPVKMMGFPPHAASLHTAGSETAAAHVTKDQSLLQAVTQAQQSGTTGDHKQQDLIAEWLISRRHWQDRKFPVLDESDYEPWIAALKHVLSSRDVYMEYSEKGRGVGLEMCAGADLQLQQLIQRLRV